MEGMDPSLLLMLSNLLQLQNHLEPTLSSSMSDNHSSAAPLLFFMIASVLSYAAALHSSTSQNNNNNEEEEEEEEEEEDDDDYDYDDDEDEEEEETTDKKNKNSHNKNKKNRKKKKDDRSNTNNSSSSSIDAFRNLSTELIWNMEPQARDAQWRSSYGLSYPVFASLVDQLKPHIHRSNLSLPADYAIAMVLSRLSHGYTSKTLASQYKLDPYLVSKITNMVTRLLATKLYSNYIKIPVGHRLMQTIQAFKELTGLPNMCGAIDGSHVKMDIKNNPSSSYYYYKCRYNYSSVLVQLVSDHKKMFWDVCVKAPGGTDDATHFRDSLLYTRLTSSEILRDSTISVRGHHIRPYIIGDWCYPLLSFLLTPFSSNATGTPAQNFFDASLMKGRAVVEHAIALLKGRWRILQDLNVGLSHAPQTIVACCVLHNICQIAGEPEPPLWKDPKETGPPARALENEKSFYYFGESLRQAMADDLQERQQQRLSTR